MVISKTRDHIQIKIKMPNPSQEPPLSSKAPNEDLINMDVICIFKIKIEGQNSDHGYIKDQWPYPNYNQDAKPKPETSSLLKIPKWGLKGHGCFLSLQNQDGEPKFGSWINQRPVTICKSRTRFQPPVRISSFSKVPNEDLKDMDVLCTFKIKIESQNWNHWYIIDQWPYPNQDQNAKSTSGTSSVL